MYIPYLPTIIIRLTVPIKFYYPLPGFAQQTPFIYLVKQTDCREWRTWLDSTEWLDRTSFFRVSCTFFYIHYPLLTFFLGFIVLFQSCCSHGQVFGKTLVHEFPIFYSHTAWNLLSSGTNTLLWWRARYQITNNKLQILVETLRDKTSHTW